MTLHILDIVDDVKVSQALGVEIAEAQLASTLRFAPGEGGGLIPATGGPFITLDADNNPVRASGTGADGALRTDLAANTGAQLIGKRFTSNADTYSVSTLLELSAWVHVFRRSTDPDDTLAVQRAAATGMPVRFVAGMGSSGGDYLCDHAIIPAGAMLFGDGPATIVRTPATPANGLSPGIHGAAFYCRASGPSAQIAGITIKDMTLYGRSESDGFSEFDHLISLNGVRDLLIERCLFKAWRGDAVYIGAGEEGGERHNYAVTIRDCRFDGVNLANRNAISFIDIDGALVENNVFENCTASTMPGAIDFEPDASAYYIIRNAKVRQNRFRNIGGNVGVIAVAVPGTVSEVPSNIEIEDNVFDAYAGSGADINIQSGRAPTATSKPNAYTIRGNRGSNGNYPLRIFDAKGLSIEDNTWTDYANPILLGFTGPTQKLRDVMYRYNALIRGGSAGAGIGMAVFGVDKLFILTSRFDDCGTGNPGASNAIDFDAGTSSYITIADCEFTAPTGKTMIAIQKEGGHTFTPETNRDERNVWSGLGSLFQAAAPGQRLTGTTILNEDPATPGVALTIPPNSTSVVLVSVGGAALGDIADASFSITLGLLTLDAYVTSTNSVAAKFVNTTDSPVTVAPGTIRAAVVKS